ncbi:hypothetical protein JTE90_028552 [Oedothorax gibbosus]|uniref:Uncharacterized protein n=1 Tax=Oedothorax gibbosus TaxID=931172 RepID=A0AAV6VX83_9ARAC|nr:hypothetical protein JTE90_028552 [Oedothorax gibbosus]
MRFYGAYSVTENMAENYVESDEDEILSESEQYKKNSFTLKWLAMRNKQVEIALQYEKIRKTEPFIEDLDEVNKKISELKVKLEEEKSIKRIKDKQHIDGHICNTLQSIIGPKNSKNRKSRYSVDQVKCIKDLLQKKKDLEKQKSSNQKAILSLEEKIDTLKNNNSDSNKKETQKDLAFNITREEFEKLDEINQCQIHSRKLADRSKMLAKAICALTEHSMSQDNASNKEQLQPVLNICKEVTESQLQDLKEIHNFILTVHGLKI